MHIHEIVVQISIIPSGGPSQKTSGQEGGIGVI